MPHFARTLYIVLFSLLLTAIARSHAVSAVCTTSEFPSSAFRQGGDPIKTSQSGDLVLKSSDAAGTEYKMTNIKKDAAGKVTEFYIFPMTYKWNAKEGKYNPQTIEFTSWRFERLSDGRYKFEKLNGNDDPVDKGSLDC